MNPMATKLTRRQLLQAGALTLAALPLRSLAGDAAQPAIISACDVGRNQHRAGLAGASGLLTLPERGHHLELDPARPGECLVFARRPGYQIARFNWRSGQQLAWYDYPDNRHGFGHGILAHGQLYTTDNDIDSGNGLLTVRDPHTLLPLREMPSGGIGPHELKALDDGTILVANGGILTLPESGRIKLNRNNMKPQIDIVDPVQGRSIASYTLDDKRLSLRHLARINQHDFAVALQYEGDGAAPLVAIWNAEQGLRLLDAPDALALASNGYAASVAAGADRIACTATKGDAVVFWDSSGRYLGHVALTKPAGIALSRDQRHFVTSNELGEIVWIDSQTLQIDPRRSQRFPVKWDNHLSLAYS